MAAYAQFGYGGYPSASQLLSTNVAQSPQTGDTPTAQSTISSANAPALSPAAECRNNNAAPTTTTATANVGGITGSGGDLSSGALSPDDMSQNSNNTAVNNSGGSTALDTSLAHSAAAVAAAAAATAAAGNSCCENGRPIMTDPVSGQTVCSCQYDSARLALSSYSRLPAASVGVYGTPYPSTDQNPYQSIGVDSSAFYSPLSNPYALKESQAGTEMSAWTSAGLQPTTGYYSYDPMSAYGYGAGYDLAARRKNATRESTATLKAWLNEHKKNPYPTKGEKIMLAIITKMTLTQVSTWFANARRRLKKENKMTWEPKNRTDDDDDALVSDEEKEKDDMDGEKTSQHSGNVMHPVNVGGMSGGLVGMSADRRKDVEKHDDDDTIDDEHKPAMHANDNLRGTMGFPAAGYHSGVPGNHPHNYHPYHHQHSAYYQHQQAMLAASYHAGGVSNNNNITSIKNESTDSKNQLSRDCGVPIPATKPKIWSLADTVACKTPPPAAYMGQHQQQQQPLMQQQQLMSAQQSHMAIQQQQQQAHMPQAMQQPQATMSNFGATPYSRAPTTAYGGFLGTTAPQLHTTNNTQYSSSNNSNSSTNNIINNHHNSNSSNNNNGIHTPTTPTTINPLALQHQRQHTHSRPSHQHPHAANQRAMGFPEAQPDTPPQTPPNMKLPNAMSTNLLLTASQVPTIATYRNSNNELTPRAAYNHSAQYATNYVTRYSEYSPKDENSSSGSSSSYSSGSPQLHENGMTFKPLFKSQQISVAGFVPPV